MKKSLLTLLICLFASTAFAQTGTEQLSHVKKIRHTMFPLDDTMTQWETRLDDQNITHYFYDINGNIVLKRTRIYNAAQSTSYVSYKYNEQNQLIEQIEGTNRYVYTYNANGEAEKREKYDYTGSIVETCTYEYTDNLLTSETVYGSAGNVSYSYVYIYDNGRIMSRERYNSSGKMNNNYVYTYNDKNQLVEENNYTISTSNSSLGMIRDATRIVHTYDESDRLYTSTTQTAIIETGTFEIIGWNEKDRYISFYEGNTDKKIREEYHRWSSTSEQYEIHEHDDYTYSSRYGADYIPNNITFTPGNITSIIMSLEKPTNTTGLSGYRVIADNVLIDSLFTTEHFEIEKQTKGTHTYRVMAVYDTIASTVSSELTHVIDVKLPAPSNAEVINQSYSSQWAVTFSFTPPTVPSGITLTGYRFKLTGGNGGTSGTADADANKISFNLWPDTRNNENNLCTIDLYAVYTEGESEAYTFQIDLRDTNHQIITKWLNERSEHTDGIGTILNSNHYYYTSSYGNELLVSNVEYDANFEPSFRYTTVEAVDYIDKWNAETMQWDKYIIKEAGRDGDSYEWYDSETTKVYDETLGQYVATEIVKVFCYLNSSYKTIVANTSTYSIDNGVQTLTKYVTHYTSSDQSLSADTIYDVDKTTIKGLVEYNYIIKLNSWGSVESKTLTSKVTYRYENGSFVKTEIEEHNRNTDTGLIESIFTYQVDGDNKTLTDAVRYYASKEYGAAKIPTNVTFKDNTLKWKAPSNPYMVPTGYRVFINNVTYTNVFDGTEVTIEGIPSGKYTFTVMSLYNGSESNYTASVEATVVNKATFTPTSVTPDVYDAELDNSVAALNEVVLYFPSAIAETRADVQATLNSRFGSVGEVETAIISHNATSITFTMPENLENGMYFLDIPEGLIIAADGTYNPALSYTFVLQLPLTYDLPAPTVTPAAGEIDTQVGLEVFTLTFDRDVYALESTIGVTGTAYMIETKSNTRTEATIDIEGYDYTTWNVTLAERVNAIGEYRLVIPAATFGDVVASSSAWTGAFESGKVNAELTFTYSIADLGVEGIEQDVVIRVVNRNIIAPALAKVYNVQGYEVGKENVAPGVYMVVYNNNVTKVHVR